MQLKTLLLSILIATIVLSCKKEPKLNDHDTIQGRWYIKKIISLNGFSNTVPMDFGNGEFTFAATGAFEYLSGLRDLYKGTWQLYEKPDESYTDANGNIDWIDGGGTILQLDAEKATGGSLKKTAYFVKFTLIDVDNFTALLCPNGVATHQYSFTRLK